MARKAKKAKDQETRARKRAEVRDLAAPKDPKGGIMGFMHMAAGTQDALKTTQVVEFESQTRPHNDG